MKKLILAAALMFGFSSCSIISFKNPDTGKWDTEKIVSYTGPASYFATKVILSYSVDDADKAEKAKIITDISGAIRALTADKVPTVDEFEGIIKLVAPNKTHWVQFATELAIVYEKVYESVDIKENGKLVIEAVNEIASGCERAAKPFLLSE